MIRVEQGDGSRLSQSGPHVFPDMRLAHVYCTGVGVELGAAAHNPFNLSGCKNVAPHAPHLDHAHRRSFELFRDLQLEMCDAYALIDMVGVADALPVPDASQDYVLSSHVVEHLPNVIGAFLEWKRILRPGGKVFMIVPKRSECDRGRPFTTLEHLVDDHEHGYDAETHPLPEGQDSESFHYHVFSLWSLMRLIEHCNHAFDLGWEIVAAQQTDSKVGNGHTIVAINHGDGHAPPSRWPRTTKAYALSRALINGFRYR
jgi:SAM-dependent methyltransferase